MSNKEFLTKSLIYTVFIITILFAIYSFSYSGTFTTDDEHILASRTISTAFDETVNDYRVLGNSRVFSYFNLDPNYGQQSLNVEPLQAVFGAQLAKLGNYFHRGIIQSIFFLNIFATILTAVCIFWILVLLDFKFNTALISSLIFGTATIVWPYTKTYFRDPLVMLFVTIAWGCALLITTDKSLIKNNKINVIFLWFIFSISLIFGILSKNTTLLSIPVFILMFLGHWRETRKNKNTFINKKQKIIISVLIIFILFVAAVWFIMPKQSGIFSRFTPFFYSTVISNIINQDHSSFLEGILGPLFSPGKSFFLYSPILIIAIISLIKYFRKSLHAWLYLFILIFVQALYYDSLWWGSVNWGLRFLLPIVPIFIISSSQFIEGVLEKRYKFPLVSFVIVSIVIQAIGIAIPTKDYYVYMAKNASTISHTAMLWSPKYSQIFWNLMQIYSKGGLDFAAWRIGVTILPTVLFLFISIGVLTYLLFHRKKSSHILITSLLPISIILIYIFQLGSDPTYQSRSNLIDEEKKIENLYSSGETIFIQSYGTPTWLYWMNWSNPEMKWIALSPPSFFVIGNSNQSDLSILFNGGNISNNNPTNALFQQISKRGDTVWFVSGINTSEGMAQVDAIQKILDYVIKQEWDYSDMEETTKLYFMAPR